MALPHIVHKIKNNDSNRADVLSEENDVLPREDDPFSDEQMDILAAVLAETRAELRDEWQAAIDKAVTELRAEQDLHEATVMNLVGNGNGVKLFEAEQTVRKLKVSAGERGA